MKNEMTDKSTGNIEKDKKTKIRPLCLAEIIYKNTDENHFLTTSQLLRRLETDYGIKTHRTTIPDDIEMLRHFGMDIQVTKSSQNKYNLVSRIFDDAELKTLIDAVASSKFISLKRSAALSDKLASLAGKYKSKELKRNLAVERRTKSDNESIFIITDVINEAINKGRKIAFQYFTYDLNKKKQLRHGGYKYTVSPYKLVWNGEFYYLVGYCDKHKAVSSFRVDRIAAPPEILSDLSLAIPKGFDMEKYLNTMFRMFSAERKTATLLCDNSVIDSIIDKFGKEVKIIARHADNFEIEVTVAITNIFFCWVFGFGGKVKIISPDDVKSDFKNMVFKIAEEL